jgi:hypothetical protein
MAQNVRAIVFFYKGTDYFDTGYGDFTGFYDWLRTDDGTIVGVGFQPLIDEKDEIELLTNEFLKFSYIVKSEDVDEIDIFFSDNRKYNPSKSADQDFRNSRIYKSSDGEFAVSFGLREVIFSSLNSTYQLEVEPNLKT